MVTDVSQLKPLIGSVKRIKNPEAYDEQADVNFGTVNPQTGTEDLTANPVSTAPTSDAIQQVVDQHKAENPPQVTSAVTPMPQAEPVPETPLRPEDERIARAQQLLSKMRESQVGVNLGSQLGQIGSNYLAQVG